MEIDNSILRLASDVDVRCGYFGHEKQPFIQADSFVSDPDALKRYCVENQSFVESDSYYPGIRMPIPLIYTVALTKSFSGMIQEYFGFNPRNVRKAVSRYSIVTLPEHKLQMLQRIPHFDAPSKYSLAAVHYLFDSDDTGTALFRYRKLGYEYVDASRYPEYMKSVKADFPNPEDYPKGYIRGSTREFEQIGEFSAKYNRVVMYRGSSLHSGIIPPDYGFDPNPETGRLTITTFVEFAE